jgi:hypothetical protein
MKKSLILILSAVVVIALLVLFFFRFNLDDNLKINTGSTLNQKEYVDWLLAAKDMEYQLYDPVQSEITNSLLDEKTNKFNVHSINKLNNIWLDIHNSYDSSKHTNLLQTATEKGYNYFIVQRAIHNVDPKLALEIYRKSLILAIKEKKSQEYIYPMLLLIAKEGSPENFDFLLWATRNSDKNFYSSYFFSDMLSIINNSESLEKLSLTLIDENESPEVRFSCLIALENFGPRIHYVISEAIQNRTKNESINNAIKASIGMSKSLLFPEIFSEDCKDISKQRNESKFNECYDTITYESFNIDNCNKLKKDNLKQACFNQVNLNKMHINISINNIIINLP